jgi:hypothetical protein
MHFSRLKNSDEPQEYDDFYKKAMRLVVVGMNHTFEADISIMEKSSSFISLEARAYSSNDNP